MPTQDRLSVVLSEFARTLVTDFPIQGILDHLVRRMVDILPIDAAGVSLMSAVAQPHLVAGSDESAVRYERLQTQLGDGPCVVAYAEGTAIAVPDLAEEDRFPSFVEAARGEGLVAVFTFPLRTDDRRLGALDLYRTSKGALDEEDMETAQTLADVATAYLLNAEARGTKSDFVATVSHEFRTPMTSIAGYVELLHDCEGGPLTPEQMNFVEAIGRNGARLTALADDLLTISRLDRAQPVHPHAIVDLGEVLTAAQRMLEASIVARRLEVTFDVPPEPVLVAGDEANLQSMVVNLVGNALKFTEDGGWVRSRVSVVGGAAQIVVSDNGLGIPESEQADLFTRFFRSSTAQEHAIQGTGLGLVIVDSIVQEHGGDISVRSGHLRGSTFTVNLPLVAG